MKLKNLYKIIIKYKGSKTDYFYNTKSNYRKSLNTILKQNQKEIRKIYYLH